MKRERIAALTVCMLMLAQIFLIGWYGRVSVPGFAEPGTRVFNLTGVGAGGVWTLDEVNGLNYWWKRFEPATLHVTLGDEVVVNLRSADLFHSFYSPAFDLGPANVEPGHRVTLRFKADREGVFQYYCTSMCGTCHFYMRGWIVVTAPGQVPIEPPDELCRFCLADSDEPEPQGDLVERGAFLYARKGCVTCHGANGHGGVANDNSTNGTVPAHDTTAQKLFLASPEDAEAFIELVAEVEDLEAVEEAEVSRFPVVRTRYLNAKEIVRQGRFSAKLDPQGPVPPLQMPAWDYLIEERQIDALLAYFVSLYDWEEG